MSVAGSVDPLQLWILTSLVEGIWYFPVLTSVEKYQRQSNYRIPYATPDALLQAVEHLFRLEYLSAQRGKGCLDWNNIDQLKEWVHGPDPDDFRSMTYFGLTAAGGARWEQECKADWSLFLNGLGSKGELMDVDGEMFTTYFHYEGTTFYRTWEYARRYEISSWDLRLMSRGRELKPWKATYWKTLPRGYRLSCKIRYGTEESKSLWLVNKRKLNLHEFTRWYQDPS